MNASERRQAADERRAAARERALGVGSGRVGAWAPGAFVASGGVGRFDGQPVGAQPEPSEVDERERER